MFEGEARFLRACLEDLDGGEPWKVNSITGKGQAPETALKRFRRQDVKGYGFRFQLIEHAGIYQPQEIGKEVALPPDIY